MDSPLLPGLIEDVAQAHWLVKRANRRMFESERALDNAQEGRQPTESVDEIFRRLQLIQRYKARYENSYQRAFRAIEAFRKSRLAELLVPARIKSTQYSNVEKQVKMYIRLTNSAGYSHEDAWERVHYLFGLQQPPPSRRKLPGEPEEN